MREVYDTAVESGYKESVKRLLPLLSNFVSDSEPAVRQVFAEQLYKLAKFFVEVCNPWFKLNLYKSECPR